MNDVPYAADGYFQFKRLIRLFQRYFHSSIGYSPLIICSVFIDFHGLISLSLHGFYPRELLFIFSWGAGICQCQIESLDNIFNGFDYQNHNSAWINISLCRYIYIYIYIYIYACGCWVVFVCLCVYVHTPFRNPSQCVDISVCLVQAIDIYLNRFIFYQITFIQKLMQCMSILYL